MAYGYSLCINYSWRYRRSSMVETFCHIRTPVFMSIMRGYDGLLLGCAIGIVLILAVRFLIYISQWAMHREDSHE